jgi:hypothetical protein
MYYPVDRSEVTEDWLADTLSESAAFRNDPIKDLTLSYLGDGLGQLSTLVLADIEHLSGVKQQLVVKLHADVPEMHEIGVKYGHYESEINFYNHLKDDIPVRTPDVHLSGYDQSNQRVVVIMESFTDWHSPDQVKGATVEEIAIAAEELAKITAAFWNAPLHSKFHWVRNMASAPFATYQDDYLASIQETLSRTDGFVPDSSEKIISTIGPSINEIRSMCCQGNQALAHWDYRVENFFYKEDEFAVIDWQLMMMTTPATDIAYLLSTNIATDDRRNIEHELIERYLERLEEQGVRDYTRDAFDNDFRLALLSVSGIPVIGTAGVDMGNERSAALMRAVSQRMYQTIEDWDALAVLS